MWLLTALRKFHAEKDGAADWWAVAEEAKLEAKLEREEGVEEEVGEPDGLIESRTERFSMLFSWERLFGVVVKICLWGSLEDTL